MRAATFSPGADLASKLDAMAQAAIVGSTSSVVRDRAVATAREVGSSDPWDGFAKFYEHLRECFIQFPDPGHDAGFDRIEPAELTLDRCAGDCDDATVLVLAIARAYGFRGAVATLSVRTEGGLEPIHAYAEIERAPGVWVSADLFEELALGVDPSERYATAEKESWPVEDRALALGFIGGIFNAIGAIISGNANKKVAKENRAGLEAQANAVVEQSESQERIASANALVQREAIAASREQTQIQAVLTGRAQDQAADTTRDVLTFAGDMVPVVAVVMLLKALAPVADSFVRSA